ncbi:auxilin-like clathrin-binding protein required for normal clathrin function [Diatrype stigma]|uniref:Auxilin-like clathrin-binding protein required for normal clathrin function n=1 Tax=Diatrype stigma TaxID=117547 RepID=A0AAN9UM51_9PEZI
MDDLSTLDWSSTTTTGKGNGITPNTNALPPRPMNAPSAYPTLRPTPSPQASARNTPLSTQGSGFAAPKPAVDSFSNLVNFGSSKNNANLSLRERQQQLEAEKRQREEEQRKKLQSQYGGGQFWDSLAQGSSTASRTVSPAAPSIGGASIGTGIGVAATPNKDDDDDLFAAFNKDTVVDTSSHFPRPAQPASGTGTPASAAQLDLRDANAWSQPTGSLGDDDDDPFGLNQLKPRAQPHLHPQPSAATDGDDDILGDLGKPVDQVRRQAPPQPRAEPGKPIEDSDSDSSSEPETLPRDGGSDPFDRAVAELIDMGFSQEMARRGLTESGAGLNIQAAVGWLLDDAHKQARSKQTPRDSPVEHSRRQESNRSRNNGSPAWMSEGQTSSAPRRGESSSPAYGDELSKKAAAMGTSFFKTANSLWKSGQKQVQKAVADLQLDDRDPSQPKWMQSAQQDKPYLSEKQSQTATDEAMMLESGARPERHSSRSSQSRAGSSRDQSPALPTRPPAQASRAPKWQQSAAPADPRSRLSQQAIEEQSAQAYVSPARRKKATPQPPQQATLESDLLNASAPVSSQPRPPRSAQQPPVTSKPSSQPTSRTITPRPPPPSRNIPPVSSAILQASTRHRLEGTAHFKRGDYDSAHTSYTSSLAGIPQSHPLCIVLLANRALTALKTGSPKQAVEDANAALGIIGPSRGEGEKVAVADGEQRDMKDLYGKVLTRKAEALEQMEKWSEAGDVWQQSVEAGVGGANAITGRQRCQKALAPKPKATPRPVQAAKPRPSPSAMADLGPQKSSEAVQRLKEANKAAEAADEEKFALSEKVDARISAWRDGKRENLRALLGSLDQVLWEGSGWKKVGLHELVMANKVKIHYMKAIAKCHPDKLPQDANTEVRLIAATVFATLNESWDKFKADNGL